MVYQSSHLIIYRNLITGLFIVVKPQRKDLFPSLTCYMGAPPVIWPQAHEPCDPPD